MWNIARKFLLQKNDSGGQSCKSEAFDGKAAT